MEDEDVEMCLAHSGWLIVVTWVSAEHKLDVWLPSAWWMRECQTCDRHLIVPEHQWEFLHGKDCLALEQAAQAAGRFTVLEGVQEMAGSGT